MPPGNPVSKERRGQPRRRRNNGGVCAIEQPRTFIKPDGQPVTTAKVVPAGQPAAIGQPAATRHSAMAEYLPSS